MPGSSQGQGIPVRGANALVEGTIPLENLEKPPCRRTKTAYGDRKHGLPNDRHDNGNDGLEEGSEFALPRTLYSTDY